MFGDFFQMESTSASASIITPFFSREESSSTHPRDAVRAATLKYYGGNELATDAWMHKYALRNEREEFVELSPEESQLRMAREFHRIESRYENPLSFAEILHLFSKWKYVLPQGSPMSAVGNPYMIQSVSNCFVVDGSWDSYGGILHTDQEQAQIMKRRGGVGHDVSRIRPKGLHVSNAARTTAGLGVYLERFSNTTREVGQDGRRGALMLTVSCRHPEIMTFINIKRDRTKVTGANMSIRWADDFMQAVEADSAYTLRWPCNLEPDQAQITKVVNAREIWNAFIDAAWESAEPGALYWDTILRESVSDCYASNGFETVCTNPCSELPLSAYDSCRLMVMNLMGFVDHPFMPSAAFDFKLFGIYVRRTQRLMDDLIDLEMEAVDRILAKVENDDEPYQVKKVELDLWQKIRTALVNGRRTGLGVTALGDCIAACGMKYGTAESAAFSEQIYKTLAMGSERENVQLARERGHFPVWNANKEQQNPYLSRVHEAIVNDLAGEESGEEGKFLSAYHRFGRRSISTTTTAPVGTISMQALLLDGPNPIFYTTGGIEPVPVALETTRRRKHMGEVEGQRVDFVDQNGDKWQEYTVYHPGVDAWMRVTGETDVTKSPYFGSTSRDIDWSTSVDLQAAAQKWISHSISKTCNLPKEATREVVSNCYMRAWKSGCKGFTIYREGSRTGVIVDKSEETKKDPREAGTIHENHAPKRPKELPCDVHFTRIKNQSWIVLVGMMQKRPYEVFAGEADRVLQIPRKYQNGTLLKHEKKSSASKYDLLLGDGDDLLVVHDVATTFDNPEEGAFTRSISLSLRHGVPVQYVVEQLQRDKHSGLTSFSTVLARILKKYIADGTKSASEKACATCGAAPLSYMEGCVTCTACGWAKCG